MFHATLTGLCLSGEGFGSRPIEFAPMTLAWKAGLRLALAMLAAAAAMPALASGAFSFVNVAGIAPPAPAAQELRNADVEKALAEPADLWERMRNGFRMPALDDPLVRAHERSIANRPEQLRAILERGRKYLHYIVEAAEDRGLPLELALLPVIESGFNPMAESPAQAAGLWQFIPGTGARYGLEQNQHLDERRDVIASTAAAFDYLAKLHAQFGDWHLALASYNWGENAVARSLERARAAGRDAGFAALSMPDETRNYVPRLQALRNIVANPAAYGIVLDGIPNKPYFAKVAWRAEIDFSTAAKLAGMRADELRLLNPALKSAAIGRSARVLELVLPVEKVAEFRGNQASFEIPSRAAAQPRR
jgi:membrane-bound lytic murein transglycosylase D